MISYVTLGVSDLATAKKFYCELFADKGVKLVMDGERICFIGKSMVEQPLLAICTPFDGEPASAGNGSMVAFGQSSKDEVDALYNKALTLGATCDGAPGERIANVFYGAYVKDLDGNKLCFNHFMKTF